MPGPKIASPSATARIARRRSSSSASFEQVAAGAGAHGGEDRLVVVEHGEDEHPGLWLLGDDPAGGFNGA